MKQIVRIIIVTLVSLFTWVSAKAKNTTDDFENNKSITRSYQMRGFEGVKVNTVAKVTFTQSKDNSNSLTIKGKEELINKLKVYVKDGVLCIDEGRKVKKGDDILVINVSAPNLNYINIDGVGGFSVNTGLNVNTLKVINNGVGNVSIKDLECENLQVTSNGVGSINLSGKADNTSLKLNGVGSINSGDLKCKTVKAISSGVGSITCYATDAIDASLNGIGSINYKGKPSIKNMKRDGIGKIKNI